MEPEKTLATATLASATNSAEASAPKLSPEDQARVDKVIGRGVYATERKPFRPWLLLLVIVGVLTLLSGLSLLIAWQHGVI